MDGFCESLVRNVLVQLTHIVKILHNSYNFGPTEYIEVKKNGKRKDKFSS